MANPCEILEVVGHLAVELLPGRAALLIETGTLSDDLQPSHGVVLLESGTLSEQYTAVAPEMLSDVGTLSELYSPRATIRAELSDTGTLAVTLMPARAGLTETLFDVGTLSERYSAARVAVLSDTGTLGVTLVPLRTVTETLSDVGTLSDQWAGVREAVLADIGTLADAWRIARSALLADAGTLSEAFQPVRHTSTVLLEQGTLAHEWLPRVTGIAILSDEGLLSDTWLPPGAATDAWTANTDTWAMSRHEGLGVNSLADVAGVLFGANGTGLYAMNAAKDAGTNIDAWVMTGLDDFGSEQVKRLRMMYAAASADGGLTTSVRDVANGTVSWHTFPFEARPAAAMAPQRAKLARGMRSRYWQFKVGNVSGAAFTLDSLSIIADNGSRRV